MANNLFIRQRNTLPTAVWEVVDEEGCAVPLINTEFGDAVAVTFTMTKQDRNMTPALIDAPANFINTDKNQLEYRPTEFDTLFTGHFYIMFTVKFQQTIVAAVNSSFTYEGVIYSSVLANANLNTTQIIFDGVKTIAQIITDFNTINDDKIESNAPNDAIVPSASTQTLTGGVNLQIFERKISYPSQRELFLMSVTKVHSTDANINPPPTLPPTGGEVEDWLMERLREDFDLIGTKDDVNRFFSTTPYFFTVNEAFNIQIFHNGVKLTRGVDYNVASTDISKQGYNQIIFEVDAGIPSAGDILTANFYIADTE